MNILYVIPVLGSGGIEKMVEVWVNNAIAQGNRCDILAFADGPNETFRELGCNVYIINIRLLRVLSSLRLLNAFFAIHDHYDVVHSNVAFANGLIAFSAKRNIGQVVIVSHAHLNGSGGSYSSIVSQLSNEIIKFFSRVLIHRYSDYKLACSIKSGEYLYTRNSFVFFPNTISVDSFRFSEYSRKRLRQQMELNNKYVILHAGRFSKEKNHEFLLKVFETVINRVENAVLVLVGIGEKRDQIQTLVRDNAKIKDNVLFLGYRTDMAELYSMADVFLLPSFVEGFPVSVVEAQASGLPSVVSNAIPKECKLTELVTFLDLKDSVLKWADASICEPNIRKREQYAQIIADKGFDNQNAMKLLLEKYYRKEK